MNLAVLIIGYSRPTGITNLIKSLTLHGITRIYLSLDGPKDLRDIENQRIIHNEINRLSLNEGFQIKVLKQELNLGIAVAVIGAIDWFFLQEECGLILEDDLLISSDFLKFADLCLKEYKDNPDVWMISGSQLLSNYSSKSETIWMNYPMIWGWATWAQKWQEMRSSLIQDKKTTFLKSLNYRYIYWKVGAKRVLSGKVDTWDTPLAFEFRVQNKFCILPPVNLVSNIGFDEMASNTTSIGNGVGTPIEKIKELTTLTLDPDVNQVKSYNLKLESHIFKIRFRHLFLPYFSFLFDDFKFPRNMRKDRLKERIKLFKVP
jgi:hypothetical protein